ncbi:hypothetical protein BJ138DRAFT_1131298 [Hygrophoropsis aurantiaca]|uniref:Uncharacterized protein n=1 Tax=Hygrophoropsis aurantiaca TaxID=72124 RepID=A0ACB7ZR92_9AGAM|nr:hypothetical protein BJ138DRAFT_1131298 [Hygrophoropsis aurantiaca]
MPRITFNNLDIDAVFDETEPVGLLSEAFGRSRGLHRIGDETVATVTAKYCGQTLTTDASFIVSALASADVVVGMSWIGLWRAVIADGRPARMVNGGACQREWGTASEDESITQSEINMPIVNAAHVGLNGSGPSSYGGNNVVEPSNSAFKVDRSKSILRDVLTGNHSSGIRVSAFVDSLELMNSVDVLIIILMINLVYFQIERHVAKFAVECVPEISAGNPTDLASFHDLINIKTGPIYIAPKDSKPSPAKRSKITKRSIDSALSGNESNETVAIQNATIPLRK